MGKEQRVGIHTTSWFRFDRDKVDKEASEGVVVLVRWIEITSINHHKV